MKTVAERTMEEYYGVVDSVTDLLSLIQCLEIEDTLEARCELRALQDSLAWLKKACDYLHRMHVNTLRAQKHESA